MSRKREKSNSKPLVLDCEPAELAELALDTSSRRAHPRKRKSVRKRTAPRVQIEDKAGARIAKPKRTAKAELQTRDIDNGTLEATAVQQECVPAGNVITMDPIIRAAGTALAEQPLPQRVNACMAAGTATGLATYVDTGKSNKPRILFADNFDESATQETTSVVEEKALSIVQETTECAISEGSDSVMQERDVRQLAAPEHVVEVTMDLDLHQAAESKTRNTMYWLARSWEWFRKNVMSRQTRKRLRVCETVSLGEKRFVAVIEIDGEQFLVGGASSSVVTLARLEPSHEFSEVLHQRWAQDPVQA